MPDISVSASLAVLMEYGSTLAKTKGAPLTPELFLLAVCNCIWCADGAPEIEIRELRHLRRQLHKAGIIAELIRQPLLEYISDESRLTGFGRMLFNKQLFDACERARKQEQTELTSDMLLQVVLEEPTEAIKSCLVQMTAAPDSDEFFEHPSERKAEEAGQKSEHPPDKQENGEAAQAPVSEKPEKRNPKAEIAALTQKVKGIREKLLNTLFGQENAVNTFTTGFFQAELLSMTDKSRVRPRATYLFAGPPGVGKTFLAEKAAELLDLPFRRFDMSEYSSTDASVEFCGSDKVYKNGKAGNVTGFVETHPKCVLLFDEVEKCHITTTHLFLQMLDSGRLRDNFTDTEVSFRDAIIILTTNAGAQLYEQSDTGEFSRVAKKVILKALQKDINPATNMPYFPAAICSRFASGNVVMFNHIGAHYLREIAKREILHQATNFESETGIKVEIDETVYTALLFAEGGSADARAIRGRAQNFFDEELYELFRLVDSGKTPNSIADITKIKFHVQLPQHDRELQALFCSDKKDKLLVFAKEQTAQLCRSSTDKCELLRAQSTEAAKELLQQQDIKLILLELGCGQQNNTSKYLNVEDVDSAARDFLRFVREMYRELPVYLLQTQERRFDTEEQTSFGKNGVRGILDTDGDPQALRVQLERLVAGIHQQHSMSYLARANKVVSFETAQSISEKGRVAEITLFDFAMSVAVEAEDSKSILNSVSKPNIRFEQVIGAEDAKKELKYFVDYLRNPKKYIGTGLMPPRGVLLYGPPGTGKTMLAKAMACESDVTFITAEGNQFLQKFVGEGEQRVHELFRTARKYAPTILFVDEIDAIAKERQGGENPAADGESVLTAFLSEMDGFRNDMSKPVFVLAATNFEVEPGRKKSLDAALLRRFDRKVYIDLPNTDERIRFIRTRLGSNTAFAVSPAAMENLATRSAGMSLADLESALQLALRSAIRDGGCKVTDSVLEEAFETGNSGEAKKWDTALLERVARHEAGHTYLCWQSGEKPSYVTIVARGDHGGYMQLEHKEEKNIFTRDELLARIRTSLGGRASEIVYYGENDGISSGASGDLANATAIAQQIVCTYGMSDAFGLAVIDEQAARTGELSPEVRLAVNRILAEEMQKAVEILSENKSAVDTLVAKLMKTNRLNGKEIAELLEAAERTVSKSAGR